MSQDTQDNTNGNGNANNGGDGPKKPSHLAYQVSEGQDGKSYFNRVGSAFEHRDREGFNIVLDATPVDGKITLRTLKERVQGQRDGKGTAHGRDNGEQER